MFIPNCIFSGLYYRKNFKIFCVTWRNDKSKNISTKLQVNISILCLLFGYYLIFTKLKKQFEIGLKSIEKCSSRQFFFCQIYSRRIFFPEFKYRKKKKRVITLVNFKHQFCQFQRFAKLVLLL